MEQILEIFKGPIPIKLKTKAMEICLMLSGRKKMSDAMFNLRMANLAAKQTDLK